MRVGIMQPYFFPYIGYWQLLGAVDKYVIYDDVNYIKSGWVNRNRILIEGDPKYFNVQLINASSYKKINEILVNQNSYIIKKKLRIIEGAYKKAPYYEKIKPLIEKVLLSGINNLAEYIGNSIQVLCDYMEITTELIYSSSIKKDNNLKGQNKVLSICRLLGADEYYNAIGGQQLYSSLDFINNGIVLKFLKPNEIVYPQFDNKFVKNLSIIDVLMFNSIDEIHQMLHEYTLVENYEKIIL